MSTRAHVWFEVSADDEYRAGVYVHYDGYPENMLTDFREFFAAVKRETTPGRTLFADPEYLAAKYVVWKTAQYTADHPLDFTGVSVCGKPHDDVRYIYRVKCDWVSPGLDIKGPDVTVEEPVAKPMDAATAKKFAKIAKTLKLLKPSKTRKNPMRIIGKDHEGRTIYENGGRYYRRKLKPNVMGDVHSQAIQYGADLLARGMPVDEAVDQLIRAFPVVHSEKTARQILALAEMEHGPFNTGSGPLPDALDDSSVMSKALNTAEAMG